MNTPAHVAASLLVWRKHESAKPTSALLVGAILPDAPMFLFFGVVSAAGYSGQEIWRRLYYLPSWQLFFDLFNSAPIFLGLLVVGWRCHSSWWKLFSSSALLHIACDLPLHHDDAHRHFLPLTHFRFASPVSYWDPAHYGIPFAIAEASLTIASCLFLTWKSKGKLVRTSAITILGLYALVTIWLVRWLTSPAGP